MAKIRAVTAPANRLVKALDVDYRYRHGEMLRWMLSEILVLWGRPAWENVPDAAKEHVHNAIRAYEEEVANAAPFEDVLGGAYMALVSSWGKSVLGQYFTPQPVARMMAEMTAGTELPPDDETGRLITACDPAVGSGVMMMSYLQAIYERHGAVALRRHSVTGIDIDGVCVRMFAIQVMANCAIHKLEVGEIVAYQGNALGNPAELQVILHASAPKIEVPPAKHPVRLEAIAKVAEQRKAEQLSLFELLEAAA